MRYPSIPGGFLANLLTVPETFPVKATWRLMLPAYQNIKTSVRAAALSMRSVHTFDMSSSTIRPFTKPHCVHAI